jgi:hypothetical protein
MSAGLSANFTLGIIVGALAGVAVVTGGYRFLTSRFVVSWLNAKLCRWYGHEPGIWTWGTESLEQAQCRWCRIPIEREKIEYPSKLKEA